MTAFEPSYDDALDTPVAVGVIRPYDGFGDGEEFDHGDAKFRAELRP